MWAMPQLSGVHQTTDGQETSDSDLLPFEGTRTVHIGKISTLFIMVVGNKNSTV